IVESAKFEIISFETRGISADDNVGSPKHVITEINIGAVNARARQIGADDRIHQNEAGGGLAVGVIGASALARRTGGTTETYTRQAISTSRGRAARKRAVDDGDHP